MTRFATFTAAVVTAAATSIASADVGDPPSFSYLLHCSGCHLEDGAGDPPEIPDLRTDLGLLLDTAEGRAYMMRVPGVTDTPIPPQEMADLLNWMVGTLYPERKGKDPVSADEVLAGRINRLSDPIKYRKVLLARIKGEPET